MAEIIKNRYEFVMLFDVTDGNPNGDPDAGNLPRMDPETSHGIITDVCLKRKVRNYVDLTMHGKPGHAIYVSEGSLLNEQHRLGYEAIGEKPVDKKLPKELGKAVQLTQWMASNFWDIRTFGAMMATNVNAGSVRGPVQFGFARSIEPVSPIEVTITRIAATDAKDAAAEAGHTMGRKAILPYGLFRLNGYVSAPLAEKSGFNEDDLSLLWESLKNMFDHDHSAARGHMACRQLIIFKHETALGNAPASQLFDLVSVERMTPAEQPARSFNDYQVTIKEENCPKNISCEIY